MAEERATLRRRRIACWEAPLHEVAHGPAAASHCVHFQEQRRAYMALHERLAQQIEGELDALPLEEEWYRQPRVLQPDTCD